MARHKRKNERRLSGVGVALRVRSFRRRRIKQKRRGEQKARRVDF
jgi:hypothetical protein